jgi:hypothetical protein
MEEWTSADDAELKKLEAEQADYEDAHQGFQAVDKVDQHRVKVPAPNETRKFSIVRSTVGGIRDAAQGIEDFIFDIAPYAPGSLNPEVTKAVNAPIQRALTLPDLKGAANAGLPERITRGLVSFAVPFTGWSKAVGVTRGASWLGRAGRVMLAGAATDITTMDPEAANLANGLRDVFGIHNDTLDALASEPDDNRLVARFKAAAVNAPVSIVTDAVFEAGLRGVRAYRAWRGTAEEASATVEALRGDMPVRLPEEAAEQVAETVTTSSARATRKAATKAVESPQTTEEVLDFLKRKTAAGATDEDVEALARTISDGPEEALEHVGINPLKVDFSALDDPEMLGKLSSGLQNVYDAIAQRLGRTGIRVTEAATARAARALASTADTLKDLYGHTDNLDAIMYASQAIVGAHSKKLLSEAQAAIAALKAGAGEDEWVKFLATFERHAYFLGALRGAGTEVGRALRTLRMVQKVGKGAAKEAVKEAVDHAKETHLGSSAAKDVAAQALDAVSSMTTPAEKMAFLGKVIDKSGDVGELSRFTRAKSGSQLTRLDTALGETRGNLFSSGTAVLNTLSGLSMIGLRGMSKTFAAIGRMALSPLGKQHSQAARVQLLQSWAYVDGAVGAWRDSIRNVLALLEREGMEEIALNADALGMKGLAGRAQTLAEEGRSSLLGEYERVDISSHERAFAMNVADLRELHKVIESWDTPALMEHSLKWLTRGVASTVNAAGTASRLGTILFVNGSDQFVGTLAARAGAQSEAARIAATEAAELQLEGRELSQYVKARMIQLTETVDGFAPNAFAEGQKEAIRSAGEVEAKQVLFQDQLETGVGRTLVGGLNRVPFFHLFVPFVKTPLRILERTAIDFTPLGLVKDRIRSDIMAGGARRDEALARLGLGMTMVYTAFQMVDDRTVVGYDGGNLSSARLSRPSYTLKIGDDQFEFSRIDPIGTLLGWGADVHAFLRDQEDVPPADRDSMAMQFIEAAGVATAHNILSKTWLVSLKNLTELAGIDDDNEFSTRVRKYAMSFGARFVPGSGIQRSIQKGIDGVNRDASTFMEGLIKASAGAGTLPEKRDTLLGRPMPLESGERLFGAKVGPGADDSDQPLLAELERLSFDIPSAGRTQQGVRLNSVQFNRWLELRGQTVRNPRTGLTLEGGLSALIEMPEYQELPRVGKVQAIRDVMNGYSQQATEALFDEDKDFATKALRRQVYDKMRLTGTPQPEIDEQTRKFAEQLGLTPKP